MLTTLQIVTVVLIATAMALSLAHALELPGNISARGTPEHSHEELEQEHEHEQDEQHITTSQLYRVFGIVIDIGIKHSRHTQRAFSRCASFNTDRNLTLPLSQMLAFTAHMFALPFLFDIFVGR